MIYLNVRFRRETNRFHDCNEAIMSFLMSGLQLEAMRVCAEWENSCKKISIYDSVSGFSRRCRKRQDKKDLIDLVLNRTGASEWGIFGFGLGPFSYPQRTRLSFDWRNGRCNV